MYKNTFSINLYLLRPKSRGYMKLRSSNPYDEVMQEPNYFDVEDDARLLGKGTFSFVHTIRCLLIIIYRNYLTGIQYIANLENANAFKSRGAKFYKKVYI